MAVLDIIRTTPPAALLTVEDAKAHLRVDHPDEDDLIEDLVAGVVDMLDGYSGTLGRALVEQGWRLYLPFFPDWRCGHRIKLPLPPLKSVASITYDPADGSGEATVSPSAYEVIDGPRGEVVLRTGFAWPLTAIGRRSVRVNFVAGYGAAEDVPRAIVQAVKLMVGEWYDKRDGGDRAIPPAAERLLRGHRVPRL